MPRIRVTLFCAAALSAACSPDSSTSGVAGQADAGLEGGSSDAVVERLDGAPDAASELAPEVSHPPPPRLLSPGAQSVDEDQTLSLILTLQAPSDPATRVSLSGLPPGARFEPDTRKLVFTPDFIQGGGSWEVQATARNAVGSDTISFSITVVDSIHPAWPTVTKTETFPGYRSLWLSQTTDDYLDSPGHAGRSLSARVIVPDMASATTAVPVRVYLHGFGGAPYDGAGSDGQFRIYPHDPMNTYWWGYAASLPGGVPSGTVPNYTQRRVLHLLEWVLRTQQGADAERVYVTGGSMGGAGAATLGLLYARHFAYVDATIGQTVPRNHRPSRIAQLTGLWGSPSANLVDGTMLEDGTTMGVWDRQDLCRLLRDSSEAREQHVFMKHGKDDPTIHFGAVTLASPLTQRSFYEALRDEHTGHYVVWDEGGHGSADPVTPAGWWDGGWSRIFDSTSYLRRDLPFPAFSHASHDWDPGDGAGNGKQEWSEDTGFAGTVSVAGDTGWNGDLAGARNRFLRWDANAIVDKEQELRMPLFVLDGGGGAAPKSGYPSIGDRFDRTLPVSVDVTIRRARSFRCQPGQQVGWEFGAASGTVVAGNDGTVTVPGLSLGTDLTTLVLVR